MYYWCVILIDLSFNVHIKKRFCW